MYFPYTLKIFYVRVRPITGTEDYAARVKHLAAIVIAQRQRHIGCRLTVQYNGEAVCATGLSN